MDLRDVSSQCVNTARGEGRPRGARFYGATVRPRFSGQAFFANVISLAGGCAGSGEPLDVQSRGTAGGGEGRPVATAGGGGFEGRGGGGGVASRPHV